MGPEKKNSDYLGVSRATKRRVTVRSHVELNGREAWKTVRGEKPVGGVYEEAEE